MVALPGQAFRFSTVTVGDWELDYAEAGPSSPAATIVSLPGSAGVEMSTAKDRLAQWYRVVEINPPGWGGRGALNAPMSQEDIGGVLAEAATKLVEGRFYLLGTSMGGANALYVAARRPDRVIGVIHEGSMAPSRLEDLQMPPLTQEQREMMAQALERGDPLPYPAPPPHPRKPWSTAEFFVTQMTHRARMMRWVEPDFSAAGAAKIVRDRKIPVLALLGDNDEILKVSQREAYASALPHATFQLVPGGSHDLQNTEPEAFVNSIRAFIEETGRL